MYVHGLLWWNRSFLGTYIPKMFRKRLTSVGIHFTDPNPEYLLRKEKQKCRFTKTTTYNRYLSVAFSFSTTADCTKILSFSLHTMRKCVVCSNLRYFFISNVNDNPDESCIYTIFCGRIRILHLSAWYVNYKRAFKEHSNSIK